MNCATLVQPSSQDHLGSASVMMGGNSSLWGGTAARYKPFGGYAGDTPGNYIQNRGFTGHDRTQADDALGVVYMNARVYLPSTGKFLTPDTLVPDPTNSQSYNRYAYVHNNPINNTDPTGHCTNVADELGCIQQERAMWQYILSLSSVDAFSSYYMGMDVSNWFYGELIGNATGPVATYLRASNGMGGSGRATTLPMWAAMVNNNRPWDLKTQFEEDNRATKVTLWGHLVDAAVVGNIHYGFVGRASGFFGLELLAAAGVAQLWGGCPQCGSWLTFGDDPADTMAVLFGIHMYNVYGTNANETIFRIMFDDWASYGLFDRDLMATRTASIEAWDTWLYSLPSHLRHLLGFYGMLPIYPEWSYQHSPGQRPAQGGKK